MSIESPSFPLVGSGSKRKAMSSQIKGSKAKRCGVATTRQMAKLIPNVTLVTDQRFSLHHTGNKHPESIERYEKTLESIEEVVGESYLSIEEPRPARDNELLLAHSRAYVRKVELEARKVPVGTTAELSTGDVTICRESEQIARLAAGGVIVAVDSVLKGPKKTAFCLSRPPGHHASRSRGAGFCIYNNVAVGALHALKQPGIEKVLIVDWDGHHGDGTQAIFERDPRVFYFSMHGQNHYPQTGAADEIGKGKGIGTTLNVPITGRKKREKMLSAIEVKLVPTLQELGFEPDLVMISAGFDAHNSDPLAPLGLKAADYATLTEQVKAIANGVPIVSVLEGGYHIPSLAASVKHHLAALGR